MPSLHTTRVVGLGEALFDLLPSGDALGGAPLNVAFHAHQLLAPAGGGGVVLSRVGEDPLGDRLRRELRERGLDDHTLQRDPHRPTGAVRVTLDGAGQPSYEIQRDAAWDYIACGAQELALAGSCRAVAFGSLAMRSPVSRASILRFLDHAPQALRMFDVNLRQDFFDADTLLQGARRATVMKLNSAELAVVGPLLGEAPATDAIEGCQRLRRRFDLLAVALTRGERGTSLITAERVIQGRGDRTWPAQDGADAVGAGDACSAGLMVGLMRGWTDRAVELADAMGGYVASRRGATPTLPAELVARAHLAG